MICSLSINQLKARTVYGSASVRRVYSLCQPTSSIGTVTSGLIISLIHFHLILDPPVGKNNINVIKLQVLQTLESTFDDVFPGKTSGVMGLFSVGTKEDLGGDDVVSSILVVNPGPQLRRGDSPIRIP